MGVEKTDYADFESDYGIFKFVTEECSDTSESRLTWLITPGDMLNADQELINGIEYYWHCWATYWMNLRHITVNCKPGVVNTKCLQVSNWKELEANARFWIRNFYSHDTVGSWKL